jgi:hypothetical protein
MDCPNLDRDKTHAKLRRMKMSGTLFADLRSAIEASGGLVQGASMRNRWDALWRSGFPTQRLYAAGLNDDHIDTALRLIATLSNATIKYTTESK